MRAECTGSAASLSASLSRSVTLRPCAANVTDMFGWIAFHKHEIGSLPRFNRTELVFVLQHPGGD
jgi:hypothetical protein